jgi:uroporphyrinogen decarboxylase
MLTRRDRLAKTIAGEPVDRVPAFLWRYFPGDDQRAADLARAHLLFQQMFDWDLMVVAPSAQFSVTGYGLHDEWRGSPSGRRQITRRVITRSLHWTELRTLDPLRGDTGRQLECLNLLGDALDADLPFLQVVYSPLTQAARLAGHTQLVRNMRMHPDRLRTGLNVLTESTLRFIEALRRTRVAGIFYVVEEASYQRLSEMEYQTFGLPFDQKILDSLPDRWWMNVVHLRGSAPMLRLFTSFPIQALNWDTESGRPELDKGLSIFRGAVSGGLSQEAHLHKGTPASVRDAVRQALRVSASRRFILSTGAPIPVTTPLSNIQAVRDSVNNPAVY